MLDTFSQLIEVAFEIVYFEASAFAKITCVECGLLLQHTLLSCDLIAIDVMGMLESAASHEE
jgi:hypothetical protein